MRGGNRRTAFLGLVLSGWLLAGPAAALNGPEHAELTNLAFKVALLHMQETHPEHKAIWDKLEADLLGKKVFEEEKSLGDITAIVDPLFFPEKLFLSPEDCADKNYRVKEVCDICGEKDDPLTPECDNAILAQGKARMERKQGQVILRSLLAARMNSRHFDVGAQESYNKFHARALRQVRNRIDHRGTLQAENWSVALRTEAVALHFLEDFFAPGHIMTRRQFHEDLASRALHNRYNSKGIEALANPSRLQELGRLLDQALTDGKAQLELVGGPRKLIGKGFRFAGGVDSARDNLKFYGDGDMRKDKALDQRTVLLLLAAYSIEEVLKEGIPGGEPADRLTLCYRPWSAEPERNGYSPKSDSTCRPWGAAALLPATQDEKELKRCWQKVVDPDWNAPVNIAESPAKLPDNLLVGYPHSLCPTTGCGGIDDSGTDARGIEGEDYVHWVPGLSVAEYGVARRGDESSTGTGTDIDLILLSISVEQIQKRDGCKFLGDRFTFTDGVRSLMGSLVSLGYSRTRAGDLDVSSWGYASQIPRVHGKYDVNSYLRLHLAYSEYSGPDLKSAAKPTAGLRYGLGVSFLFVEGGAELGYVVDKPGHLKKTAVFTLGVRVQYSLRP